ncbi:MAG: histidine phosphotransferase family protein [Beijerinckiaceae bacterium]
MPAIELDALDLAALLCSRVCHDVISPVGAIVNGLEVLEEEKDAEMRAIATDLIRKSARTASAKLQFCRLAFGAAGSAGASIDMGEAGETAMAFVGSEKVKLDWLVPRENRPKQQVKLVLNMLLIEMQDDYGIGLRRAPDVKQACNEAWGRSDGKTGEIKIPFFSSNTFHLNG